MRPPACAARRPLNCFLLKGDMFRLSRVAGETPQEYRDYLEDHPIARNRSSTVGRSQPRTGIPNRFATCSKDPDYGRQDLQELARYRTLMAAPMILEDEVVGVLSWCGGPTSSAFDEHANGNSSGVRREGAIVLRHGRPDGVSSPRGPSWPARSPNWKRCESSGKPSGRASTWTRCSTGSSPTPCGSRKPTAARSWSRGGGRHLPCPGRLRQQP